MGHCVLLGRASLPPLVKPRLQLAFAVCGVSVGEAQTDGPCPRQSSERCGGGDFPFFSFFSVFIS